LIGVAIQHVPDDQLVLIHDAVMSSSSGVEGDRDDDGAKACLERLGAVVRQRSDTAVWRAFLVAQATVWQGLRRRERTTQRMFLTGERQL
jgi:hypothetical protein